MLRFEYVQQKPDIDTVYLNSMRNLDMTFVFVVITVVSFWILTPGVHGSESQEKLIKELFLTRNYEALNRPVHNQNDTVIIYFAVTLNILVFVRDQDQVMKTNGYLDLNWTDPRLAWDPSKYGGIEVLRLPIEKIWQPDIALTNTVDGQFWPNYKSNAVIYADGTILWVPPFIFKSGCDTNPYYFPFDRQLCNMVFRSLTYTSLEVDLESKDKMDLKDYDKQPSGAWDIAEVPLKRTYRIDHRRYGHVPIVSVQLDMWVARKAKFYVTTFLLPCVCIAFLTVFVFYLPTSSGEKLCLSISILFSIVIFLLILIDVLPPSDSLPLMTKFLLFTFVCNLLSAFLTTICVRWNFRTSQTIRRPVRLVKRANEINKASVNNGFNKGSNFAPYSNGKTSSPQNLDVIRFPTTYEVEKKRIRINKELDHLRLYLRRFAGYDTALHSVFYIAQSMQEQDQEDDVTNDWKFITLVIDRLLLWIFFIGNAIGSCSILLNSPYLFAETKFASPLQP